MQTRTEKKGEIPSHVDEEVVNLEAATACVFQKRLKLQIISCRNRLRVRLQHGSSIHPFFTETTVVFGTRDMS